MKNSSSIGSQPLLAPAAFPVEQSQKKGSELQEKISRCWESIRGIRSINVDVARAAIADISAYIVSPHEPSDSTVQAIYALSNFLILQHPKLSKEEYALLERLHVFAEIQKSPAGHARILANPSRYFRTPLNKEYLAKWQANGYELDAFLWNPTVPKLIFEGHLHHKMKAYGMMPHYDPETHKFQIIVDGKYVNADDLAQKITTMEERFFGRRSHFLVSKENPQETWNFLPEVGLTKWKEREWTKLKPFAHLTVDQITYAQKHALLKAPNPEGKPQPYVIEIVGSWNKYREIPLLSGYQETFSCEHPWIRMIDPKTGALYSIGFNLGERVSPLQPTSVVKGVFRSPDPWETIEYTARPVTGIALTEDQFKDLIAKVEEAQEKEVHFNFIEHNCTKFIEWVVRTFGPEESRGVSFSADISEVFYRVLPRWGRKGTETVTKVQRNVQDVTYQFIPPIVKDAYELAVAVLRLIVERTIMMISGRWFVYDKQKEFSDKVDPHAGIPWYHLVTHARIACKEHLIRAFLPRKMYEWQLRQPGTRIYPKGTKLFDQYAASVPNPESAAVH